jgi:hypothetical protein
MWNMHKYSAQLPCPDRTKATPIDASNAKNNTGRERASSSNMFIDGSEGTGILEQCQNDLKRMP